MIKRIISVLGLLVCFVTVLLGFAVLMTEPLQLLYRFIVLAIICGIFVFMMAFAGEVP